MGTRWTDKDLQKLGNRIVDHTGPLPANRVIHIPETTEKYSRNVVKNIPKKLWMSEDDLQRQCFAWFKFRFPDYQKRMYHIPNGGFRDKKTVYSKKEGKDITFSPAAKKLKEQGTLSGVWDIFLSVPKKGFAGLYIEMKTGDNDLTDNQVSFKEANEPDYKFEVCYSFEEFESVIINYLQ